MRLVTPISHLFRDTEFGKSVALLSDGLEARPDIRGVASSGWPAKTTHIHFSDPSLDAHLSWDENQKAIILGAIKAAGPETSVVSFHLSRDFPEAKLSDSGRYLPSGQALTMNEMRVNCGANMGWLRRAYAGRVFFENNNYFDSGAYEVVCNPHNIQTLISEFADGLLLDLAHGIVSADNLRTPRAEYFEPLLDCEIGQVHLSAPSRTGQETLDSHGLPGPCFLAECEELLGLGRAYWPETTIEYYSDGENLLRLLEEMRLSNVGI